VQTSFFSRIQTQTFLQILEGIARKKDMSFKPKISKSRSIWSLLSERNLFSPNSSHKFSPNSSQVLFTGDKSRHNAQESEYSAPLDDPLKDLSIEFLEATIEATRGNEEESDQFALATESQNIDCPQSGSSSSIPTYAGVILSTSEWLTTDPDGFENRWCDQ
jgi:hypothetical protein